MKKSVILLIISLVICTFINVPCAFARDALIKDDADVFTAAQEEELNEMATEVSNEYDVCVAVATVKMVSRSRLYAYAKELYTNSDYGDDGIILVFSYYSDDERYFAIYTQDYAAYAIDDSGLDYIENAMTSVSDRSLYAKGMRYIEACDYLLGLAEDGNVYGSGSTRNTKSGSSNYGSRIIISLIIGGIVGLIAAFSTTSPLVSELKSVKSQSNASNYAKNDSFKLTDSRECFLYAHETRTVRQNAEGYSGGRGYRGGPSGGHPGHGGHHGSSGGRSGRI